MKPLAALLISLSYQPRHYRLSTIICRVLDQQTKIWWVPKVFRPFLTADLADYCLSIAWTAGPENFDIPAGHMNSDMRHTSCNIGLNRRRDLTLREDLCFYTEKGKSTLGEIFKVLFLLCQLSLASWSTLKGLFSWHPWPNRLWTRSLVASLGS